MNQSQFERLTTVFWKTGNEQEQAASFREYQRALRAFPERAVDGAIDRAIAEGDRMPLPSLLRRWCAETQAKMRGTVDPSRRMVVCIGKESKGCGELFPIWTFCPKCHPEKAGQAAGEMVAWSQGSARTVEDWEAQDHTAEPWYSSHDPRPGDNDPILTEPPHVTEQKRRLAESLAAAAPEGAP